MTAFVATLAQLIVIVGWSRMYLLGGAALVGGLLLLFSLRFTEH